MIVLSTTSDVLRVTTSAAVALDVHASYVDNTTVSYTPSRQNTAITTATTTTVLASPGASTQRGLKLFTAHARGGANTVTVEHFDGTSAYRLASAALASGETLAYEDGAGWRVIAIDGATKGIGAQGPIGLTGTTGATGPTGATGATGASSFTDIQRFSGPGTYTWTKPAGTQKVDIYVWAVGGASGSGRNNGAIGGTNSTGAPGGSASGPKIIRGVDASTLPSTVTVTIGADGIGGAAQATASSNGNAATIGGTTSFGAFISCVATSPGLGGTVGSQSAASGNVGFFDYGSVASSLPGGTAQSTTNSTSGIGNPTGGLAAGGGAGGGINVAGTAFSAGSGGSNLVVSAGTAGVTAGASGGNGGAGGIGVGGAGGGGGASNPAGNGGDGGEGGFPGGGAGGGGACAGTGSVSGAGKKGGGALVVVISVG